MDFLPAHSIVTAPGARPTRTLFVLHGMFGTGCGWRRFSSQLVEACPRWRAVQVDLRNHGRSMGAPGPHTLEASAGDLARLGKSLGGPPDGVCGHSFGGKVAMQYARAFSGSLRMLWVMDCPPGAGGGAVSEVGRVLSAVREIPLPVARRSRVTRALILRGISPTVSSWMATHLRPDASGRLLWHFDAQALEEMLEDSRKADFHPFLESPPPHLDIHLVRAARSSFWTAADLRRLELLNRVSIHVLEDAGHWLHVQNPTGLLNMMRPVMASL